MKPIVFASQFEAPCPVWVKKKRNCDVAAARTAWFRATRKIGRKGSRARKAFIDNRRPGGLAKDPHGL